MAKQIARLLRTDVMADIDVPAIAQFLQSQGRRGDSVLAHINPQEAALLKKMGGAETVNPVTGLPEYFKITDYGGTGYDSDYDSQPSLRYRPPKQTNDLLDQVYFDIESDRSPYTVNEYAPPVNLTPPDIDPIEYYRDVEQQVLNRAAQQQYAGSAFPYDPAKSMDDPAFSEAYRYVREPVSKIPEFPSGMSARMSLLTPEQKASAVREANIAAVAELDPVQIRRGQQLRDIETARKVAEKYGVEDKGTIGRGIDDLEKSTGLKRETLARLGLAGLGALQGVYASRQAAEQGREARRETEALARPYQQRGQELIRQAQAGELTAQGQQSLQALRARLAQGAEARGGVGAAQAAAQIEAYRQNLLQNQFDYGQKISNIGDQLMLGAIRTGLEADRYAANLSNTYFTNMARIAAGVPTGTQGA